MRITIIQGPFLPVPALRGGAVEKACFALGQEWARRGHAVTHVSRRFPGLPDSEEIAGVQHLRVASRDAPSGALAFRLAEARYGLRALRVLPPADVLLMNSVVLPLLVRDRRRGLPVYRVGRPPKGQFRLYPRLGWPVAVSRAVAAAIEREAPAFAGRVAAIGGPVTPAFHPLAADELGERPPRLLYVGRLHPEKGLHLLIEAFARLAESAPQWQLAIVGPHEVAAGGGGTAYLERLRRLAAPLGARVEFVGPLYDEAQLRARYREASLFCYPSLAERGEGLSVAPMEAMAMGTVPLLSGLDCFDDYLEPGVSGFRFDHRAADPVAALAAALAPLLGGAVDLAPLRRRVLEVAAGFTVEACAERYLAVFERALAAADRRQG
ncbi:MAG: glycosyltransferase family 4 protein [Tistlia sp.]|uniref:glycosyltransferase family 4 protein n=1 Tax=Tistlia sp. TaxID=3057121 RepID=UPI0034A40BF6